MIRFRSRQSAIIYLKKKMNKDRRWLSIAIMAVLVALFWVGLSAAEKLRRSTIPQDIEKVMTPLDPNIDRSIFIDLGKRKGG